LVPIDPFGVGAGVALDDEVGVAEPVHHLFHRHARLDQRPAAAGALLRGEASRGGEHRADAQDARDGTPPLSHGALLLLELGDDLLDLGLGGLEPELAGPGAEVAAAAVGCAEVARADLAGAVEDRMADRDVARLAALAAEDADLDVPLRVERVDQE